MSESHETGLEHVIFHVHVIFKIRSTK